MSGPLNPEVITAGETITGTLLAPGNVFYAVVAETASLECMVVEKIELTAEGAVMVWFRKATRAEFAARQREGHR